MHLFERHGSVENDGSLKDFAYFGESDELNREESKIDEATPPRIIVTETSPNLRLPTT
jgi:hypothetical protein